MPKRILVIDPGHGGSDRANKGPTGYIEAEGVLDIAFRLREFLLQHFDVKMTRAVDETVPLYRRSKIINGYKADFAISVHTNAAADTEAGGIETWHSLQGEWGAVHHQEAKRLAKIVQQELVAATGLWDRGIKTRLVDNNTSPVNKMDYYSIIRRSNCPTLIVECGFHTNPAEEKLLKTVAFRAKVAQAIADGVLKAYPPPPDPLVEAVEKLYKAGVLTSSEYWIRVAQDREAAKGEYVAILLQNMAKKVTYWE